jgi:hypothetical protein
MCKKFIFQRPSAMAKSFVKLSRGPTKKESKTTEKLIPSHSNNQMGRQVNVPNDPASCVMVWAAGSNHLLPSVERNKKQVSADYLVRIFSHKLPTVILADLYPARLCHRSVQPLVVSTCEDQHLHATFSSTPRTFLQLPPQPSHHTHKRLHTPRFLRAHKPNAQQQYQ